MEIEEGSQLDSGYAFLAVIKVFEIACFNLAGVSRMDMLKQENIFTLLF